MLPTVSASFLSSVCVFCVRGCGLLLSFFAKSGDGNKLWPKPGENLLHPPLVSPSFYYHKTDVSRQ